MANYNGKLDLERVAELRIKNGLSHREIGKVLDVDPATVCRALKRIGLDGDGSNHLKTYKAHRAEILASQQLRILESLTDEKLSKASARDLAIVFGTLYDKERLERGKSTQNTSVFQHVIEAACEA